MTRFATFLSACLAFAAPALAQDEIGYPVILPDLESQIALGVMEKNYGPPTGDETLANRCYYYGDGGSLLSVSDEFLAIYQARGFTLRTLCLGMISGIGFHPETGDLLATVQMVDVPAASAPDYFGEPGPVGPVTTIGLPQCFSRGLPLSDCVFRFDPFNGEAFSAERTESIAAQGAEALRVGRAALASGRYAGPCPDGEIPNAMIFEGSTWVGERSDEEKEACYAEQASEEEPWISGYFLREYHAEYLQPGLLPYGGFVDFSPVFEEGFAYAIFADGAAGPSHEIGADQLKLAGKGRSNKAVIEGLKGVISKE